MIVYKAMRRNHRGRLTSTFAFGKAEKHYRQGVNHHAPHWLAGKGYYLIAFGSLRRAVTWGAVERNVEVWKCEATGIIRYKALPQRLFTYSLSYGEMNSSNDSWPKGTVMCKSIKLLERVA